MSALADTPIPGAGLDPARMPGHFLLAQLGKRVLRPGGIGLTRRLLALAAIGPADHVVEFGPGLGVTARRVLACGPASYTGVERDELAAAATAGRLGPGPDRRCVVGAAQATGLEPARATLVVGEAMLTMQRDERKREIVAEAWRLLQPGGRYVIHELALRPDDVPAAVEDEVATALSQAIHVGARPLTVADWRRLLTDQGFTVAAQAEATMALLHPSRVLCDERLGAVRIGFNMLRRPVARRRVLEMRRVFRRHRAHMAAVGLIAVKPGR